KERLGRGAEGPNLGGGRLVIADADCPLGILFGALAPGHEPTAGTRRLALFAVQVAGVPALHAEETLWACRSALTEIDRRRRLSTGRRRPAKLGWSSGRSRGWPKPSSSPSIPLVRSATSVLAPSPTSAPRARRSGGKSPSSSASSPGWWPTPSRTSLPVTRPARPSAARACSPWARCAGR